MNKHLIHSLLYTFMSIGVTLFYLLIPLTILIVLRILLLRKNGQFASIYDMSAWKRVLSFNVVISFFIIFVGIHTMLYIKLRNEFMGEDNANLVAKEYFVSGQMINAPLSISSRFMHPESSVLKPYWFLQEEVYKVGGKYLPEKDGEKAVWRQKWFLHPYIRNQHKTKDWTTQRYSPDMVALLDDIWQVMEVMATSPFADSQMKYQQYYRNFPGMASYWTLNKGQYLEKSIGSARVFAQDAFFIERTKQLVAWLLELEGKWQDSAYTKGLIDEHPIIKVLHQGALMGNLFLLMRTDILNKNFSCENEYTTMYRDVRNEFAAPEAPLFAMSPQKRKGHKEGYIDSEIAHFYKRILKQYCGYDVAGKEKPSRFDSHDSSVRHLFKKEYTILEEIFHGE